MSPFSTFKKSNLIPSAEFIWNVLQDVMLSAYGEMEIVREQDWENGTGHALVVADSGRANGCGQTGGRAGRSGRDSSRRNGNSEEQQLQQHGHQ